MIPVAKRTWDQNNPEDTVTPEQIEQMTDAELEQWDQDCDAYNEGR